MANEMHVNLIKSGANNWNRWTGENPHIQWELDDAKLDNLNLSGARLTG